MHPGTHSLPHLGNRQCSIGQPLALPKTGGGGHMRFYPYEKGSCKIENCKIAKLHIEGEGHEKFPLFKRGSRKMLPCFVGGRKKVSDPRFLHFVAPPSP